MATYCSSGSDGPVARAVYAAADALIWLLFTVPTLALRVTVLLPTCTSTVTLVLVVPAASG